MVLKLSSISAIRPKIRINPSELGYIRPDKSIAFQTSEAAQTYAKNVVIKELYGKNPHEKGVILKDNIIIKELDGGASSIDLNAENIPIDITTGATFVHGHPTMKNGHTTPLSLGDFILQIGYKFKTMMAYNADGEFCRLDVVQKSGNRSNFLPKKVCQIFESLSSVGKIASIFTKYIKMWTGLFPKEFQSYVEPLFHFQYSGNIISNPKLAAQGNEISKDVVLMTVLGKEENKIFNSLEGQKVIHDFWVKNAEKYGYKYSTNFSNLNS